MGKLTDSYNLKKINPILSKEWHPTKNGKLTPEVVTPCSGLKVWWICEKNHEWAAKVGKRAHGNGCPYCSGKAVCQDNCLQTKNPEISQQWHPTKNGNLTPNDVTPGKNSKVWWQCEKGHEWQALIKSRTTGARCPYCTKKLASKEYNLQLIHPNLSDQWHPTKNNNLSPEIVTPKSVKKIWWQCETGHQWKAVIAARSKGNGCPYCAGQLASKDRNLKVLNPKLAEQWHPVKNGKLAPEDILPGAHKKAWWQCNKGHEWEAFVFSRNKGAGCPYCIRQKN